MTKKTYSTSLLLCLVFFTWEAAWSLETDISLGYGLKQQTSSGITALSNQSHPQETAIIGISLQRHRWGDRWFPRLPSYKYERNLSKGTFNHNKTKNNRWNQQHLSVPVYRISNHQQIDISLNNSLTSTSRSTTRDVNYIDKHAQSYSLLKNDKFEQQVKTQRLALNWKGHYNHDAPLTGISFYAQQQQRVYGIAIDKATNNSLYYSTINSAGLTLKRESAHLGLNINVALDLGMGVISLPKTPTSGDNHNARLLGIANAKISLLHISRIQHAVHWHTNLYAQANYMSPFVRSNEINLQTLFNSPWGITGTLAISF
jgi:hypothetical protein